MELRQAFELGNQLVRRQADDARIGTDIAGGKHRRAHLGDLIGFQRHHLVNTDADALRHILLAQLEGLTRQM